MTINLFVNSSDAQTSLALKNSQIRYCPTLQSYCNDRWTAAGQIVARGLVQPAGPRWVHLTVLATAFVATAFVATSFVATAFVAADEELGRARAESWTRTPGQRGAKPFYIDVYMTCRCVAYNRWSGCNFFSRTRSTL